jgi:protein-S-isoprenylcysteine O-methyltransferase Ste14
MARALNKKRMLASRVLIASAAALILFTRQFWTYESALHETLDALGYVLIVFCGMGRLYTTAFLGGHKNETLVTQGPFSVVRNPLYVFSWLGFTGFAIFSNNVWVMALVPVGFYFLYLSHVRREEAFLQETFGQAYSDYLARVPRFIPDFSKFHQPDEITIEPRFLLRGLLDNVWWFIIPLVLEMTEF